MPEVELQRGYEVDTDERRMISNIGCEDCVGALYQWQLDQSYSYQGGTHTHPGGAAVDPKPPWTWYNLAAGKGGIYHQGDLGEVKAIAGGSDASEAAGSQGRRLTEEPWWKSFGCTARFVAEPLQDSDYEECQGDLVQGNNAEHDKEEIC
jgi:hypothetical protein